MYRGDTGFPPIYMEKSAYSGGAIPLRETAPPTRICAFFPTPPDFARYHMNYYYYLREEEHVVILGGVPLLLDPAPV